MTPSRSMRRDRTRVPISSPPAIAGHRGPCLRDSATARRSPRARRSGTKESATPFLLSGRLREMGFAASQNKPPVCSLEHLHVAGVTGRFVRNCTLSGKARNFSSLHKRSFSNGNACPRISGPFGLPQTCSKTPPKGNWCLECLRSASVRVLERLSVRFFTNRAVTP